MYHKTLKMSWYTIPGGLSHLKTFIYFSRQIVKVLHADELALHKLELTIAFSNCLLRRTLAMQQINCKLGWQVHLRTRKAVLDCDMTLSQRPFEMSATRGMQLQLALSAKGCTVSKASSVRL